MSEPIKPATDEDIQIYREWSRHMLSYPKIASLTVVDRLFARIESDAKTIKALNCVVSLSDEIAKQKDAGYKALELERDTIQEYADQVGANLTAAEGTIKERDEKIARLTDQLQIADSQIVHLQICGWSIGDRNRGFCDGCNQIQMRLKQADRG